MSGEARPNAICLREQQTTTSSSVIVKCLCPQCSSPPDAALAVPVKDGEFFCRCGGEDNAASVNRCDAVVARARRLLVESDDWIFGGGETDREFLRVLWFAIATEWNVTVRGDQWFSVELTDRERRLCWFQCDDPFDGLCAGYVFMRGAG